MSLSYVMHKTGPYIMYPMYIVADNAKDVATHIIESSEECQIRGLKADFKIDKVPTLELDPGGMYFSKTPHVKFEVEGTTCDVQLTKVDDVLYCMEHAIERLPGIMRFGMWYWNFVMPVSFFNELKSKLTEISKSDAVIHAQIDEDEVKAKIEAECPFVRFNIPREQ